MRLGAALVSGPAGLAVLVGAPGWIPKIIGLLGLLVAVGWIAAWRRARTRLDEARGWTLTLDAEGIGVRAGKHEADVGWTEVDETQVDEDRLLIEVVRHDGSTVVIPPGWEGFGLHELRDVIESARADASRARHD